MRILVLAGGQSPERSVSLVTGKAVKTALEDLGHQVELLDPGPDLPVHLWNVRQQGCDFVWIALHGGGGEDGSVQAMLEWVGLPYQGSGVAASALAMDKGISKQFFAIHDIPTPPALLWKPGQPDLTWSECQSVLGSPVVIKPSCCGSTVGISIVSDPLSFQQGWELARSFDQTIVVERYIPGQEITVSILDQVVLPMIEIVPAQGDFYDYEAKYAPGGSRHLIPPRLTPTQQERIAEIAQRSYQALGCQGLARVDFRIDPAGDPWVLEVNTLPGMTPTSLCPDAAAAWGWSFVTLVERVLNSCVTQRLSSAVAVR